jgi:O-antigen ligase
MNAALATGRRLVDGAFPDRNRVTLIILLVGMAAALAAGSALASGAFVLAFAIAVAPVGLLLLHYPFGALLVWAALLPFFLNVQSATGEASVEVWLLHRLLMPTMLLLLAVYHFLGLRRSAFRLHLYDLAVVGFLVLGVMSVVLTSGNVDRFMVAFFHKVIVPVSIFWYVRAITITRRDLNRLMLVGLFTIGFQGAIGLLSWIAPSVLPDGWLGRAGERTTGTFGGPAPYTITLVFFALLAVYFALRSRERLRRTVLVGFVSFALVAVFLSLSRGSWLGAGVAFAGLALLRPRLVAAIGLAGVVLAGGLALGPVQEQFDSASDRLATVSTIEDRLITNHAAVRMIADRPVFGFGFQNFERFDEGYKRRVDDIPLKLGGSSHNTYLNMAAELGLVGLGLYFAPVLALGVATIRARPNLPNRGVLTWPLVVILWLALIDQFIVSNFLEMLHAYSWGTSLWWLTLGLIAATLDQAAERQRGLPDRSRPG